MNKKLLLFCVTMLASVTMFAQNWAKPKVADYQFASELKVSQQANTPYWEGDTTVYYLYNVEADAFLSNAQCPTHAQWSTHAALKVGSGNPVMIAKYRLAPIFTTDTTYVEVDGEEVMKVDTTNIEIPEWDGKTYTIVDFYNNRWWYVFPTSTYAMFVDNQGQEDHMWDIKSMGNGVYRFSVSDLNPAWNSHAADSIFGNPETYLGFNKLDNDYDPSLEESSIVMPLTPMLSVTNKAYNPGAAEEERMEDAELCIDWKFMPVSEFEKYQSHLKAWNYLADGLLDEFIAETEDNYGTKFDLSKLKAILNSTTPVLYEEIEEGIAEVKKAILAYRFELASDDNPVDATDLLVNPDFSIGNISGWTLNYVQGSTVTNLGYQGANYSNGDVTVNQFIEAWANSNFNKDPGGKRTLGNGSVYQLVKNLPAGKYSFECDAISSRQDESNQGLEKGAYLFAKAGENIFKEAIHTNNNAPEHFELMFINATEADLEFGFMTENTTVNWICADNFTLKYYGSVEDDPFKVLLDAKIAQYEKEYPDVESLMANNDIKEAYADQLDAAKNCTSDYQKEDSLLTEAYKALVQSVADYVRMEDLMEELSAKAEAFENGDFPDLGAILGEYYEFTLVEAYNEGTADAAMIDTISSTVSKMIVEYITANVKPGDELTPLIMNPDFNTDFSGWQVSGSAPVWGGLNSKTNGQGANQSAKYGEIDVNGGNAEKWHASFTMSQIVRDMPKGAYKLTVQAFERNDDATGAKGYWDQNPEIGNEAGINAYLFCNDFKKKIHNIYAFAQAEQIYESDELADVQTDYGWIPNGMTGSNFYFHLDEDRKTYQNEINFTLTTDGDSILIGLTNPANNTWVIFDNFRLFYIGADASAYMDAINELLTKLNGLFEETIGGNDAKQMVQDAIEALNQAVASNEGDKCLEAIGQAEAALEYAKTSIADYAALDEAWNNLISSIEENLESAPTDVLNKANTLVDDIDNVLTNLNKNNEEVEALIDRANYFSSALKITVDYSDASVDNPVDLSEVIINSTFDTIGDFTGWSSGFGAGGTTSTNAECYEKGFNVYQDLSGLPAGHYVAYVQAFYRHGSSSDDYSKFSGAATSNKEAYFYATSSIEAVETEVAYCSEGRVPTGTEWVGTVATSESGTGYIMPNTMQAMQLWCNQTSEEASELDKYTNGALYYNHFVQVKVGEDGKLRIGVKKDGNIGADWFICDNFRLYYIGTAGTDPAINSGIEDIVANEKAIVGIYNLAGQKLAAPVKGLNIINGKKYFVK
ncbi:MAG: hypothetical protein IKN15_00495 [Bacteroidaceae bacterium]|nr:hypothetical protein [Bacteroidaceae bacterium]